MSNPEFDAEAYAHAALLSLELEIASCDEQVMLRAVEDRLAIPRDTTEFADYSKMRRGNETMAYMAYTRDEDNLTVLQVTNRFPSSEIPHVSLIARLADASYISHTHGTSPEESTSRLEARPFLQLLNSVEIDRLSLF